MLLCPLALWNAEVDVYVAEMSRVIASFEVSITFPRVVTLVLPTSLLAIGGIGLR